MAVLTHTLPEIEIEGVSLDDYIVVDVSLHKSLLHPSSLGFTIRKKSLLRNESDIYLDLSGDLLGCPVRIKMVTQRRDNKMNDINETLTFSGIICGVQTSREEMGKAAYVQVTAYSPDYLLVDNPHCASFEDMSLAEIIREATSDYTGNLNMEIDLRQKARLPYVVQYNETTYQFLSRLAQRYGEYLFFDNNRMYFGQTPSGKNITLHPDVDVLGFSYDLNLEHPNFRHAQHNFRNYANTVENGYNNVTGSIHSLTDIAFSRSHSIYKKSTLQNLHSSTQEYSSFAQNRISTTVEGWGAKARMMTCHLRTNRADICIGDRITIKEISDEGSLGYKEHQALMVVGVDYYATIDGHFENKVAAIPADSPYAPYGLVDLYPVCESQRARVVDNKDPESLGRIRVQFLWQEYQPGNRISPWLRITQPHGGDDKGFYFIPEIGEEVMVAFENGNAEKPYVVGTLYHGKQQPGKQWPDTLNNVKAIRTRNGHTVEIHDEGNGGYIRIYDYKKENYILTYSTDEKLIKLESTGNIELYAARNIIMRAGQNIEMTAGVNKIVQVGVDRIATIGVNDTEVVGRNQIARVGNDRTFSIGHNQSGSVGNNDLIQIGNDSQSNIGANKYVEVQELDTLSAKNIRLDADEKMLLYSKAHDQVSDDAMNIEGGKQLNCHANNIKIN